MMLRRTLALAQRCTANGNTGIVRRHIAVAASSNTSHTVTSQAQWSGAVRTYAEEAKKADIVIEDREVDIDPPKEKDVTTIVLPRKGTIQVPQHIKKIGDAFVALDMIESLVLGEYIRAKLGLDRDSPDPLTSMLEQHQFASLTSFPGPNMGGGGGGGMPMMTPEMMAAMAAMAGGAGPAAGAAAEEEKEEEPPKTHFNIKLEKFDADKKINLIKELRKAYSSLSIKEAKDLVESAPSTLQKDVAKEEAEKLKAQFEAAGGTIVLE